MSLRGASCRCPGRCLPCCERSRRCGGTLLRADRTRSGATGLCGGRCCGTRWTWTPLASGRVTRVHCAVPEPRPGKPDWRSPTLAPDQGARTNSRTAERSGRSRYRVGLGQGQYIHTYIIRINTSVHWLPCMMMNGLPSGAGAGRAGGGESIPRDAAGRGASPERLAPSP